MSYKTFVNGYPLNASELNTYLMSQSVATFADSSARSTAIDSPVEGQLTYLESDESYYKFDGDAWVQLNLEAPRSHNYIINGAFDVWQRGTSFSPVSGSYTADRWQTNFNGTGSTRTVSRQAFTAGELQAFGYGQGEYYLRYDQSVAGSGGTFANISTRLEDVRTFANQTVTLSFYAKASSSISAAVTLGQVFGSGGSSSVYVDSSTESYTTDWQRFSINFTLPSIASKTIGSGNYLWVVIQLPLNTTFTFDIWGVQLEAGSVATPFKRNANSLQGELAACQRYYWRTQSGAGLPLGLIENIASNQSRGAIVFPVEMRAAPSASVGDGTQFEISQGATANATTSADQAVRSTTLSETRFFHAGGFTAGNAGRARSTGINGYFEFSAEL